MTLQDNIEITSAHLQRFVYLRLNVDIIIYISKELPEKQQGEGHRYHWHSQVRGQLVLIEFKGERSKCVDTSRVNVPHFHITHSTRTHKLEVEEDIIVNVKFLWKDFDVMKYFTTKTPSDLVHAITRYNDKVCQTIKDIIVYI